MVQSLTAANIESAVQQTDKYLQSAGLSNKDRLKIRLGVEEALLNYATKFGPDGRFEVRTGQFLKNVWVVLCVPGPSYDPFSFADDADDESAFIGSVLVSLGQRPSWRNANQVNIVTFSAEKEEIAAWIQVVVAMLLSVVFGFLARFLPESVISVLQNELLSPLLDTFIGFLNAIAGPMIFLSVIWGIYSMGDANTFSVIGRKLTARVALYITITTVCVGLLSILFFDLDYGEIAQGNGLASIYSMILDIVPDNLFTPFSRGNTLQILFVAIAVGITMVTLGERTQGVAGMCEQLNSIVQGLMRTIGKLVPFYVFLSLFSIIISSNTSVLSFSGKFLIINLSCYALVILSHVLHTALLTKLSPLVIWKNSFPTLLIALTTASSSAAFTTSLNTCEKIYHVSPKLARFGVPFTQILYKPGICLMYVLSVLSMAEANGIPVSFSWFFTLFFMAIILSAATPPIPGGALASFSILFVQFGIPIEQLAIIISLNTLLDFFHTGVNVFCDQLLIVDEDHAEKESLKKADS